MLNSYELVSPRGQRFTVLCHGDAGIAELLSEQQGWKIAKTQGPQSAGGGTGGAGGTGQNQETEAARSARNTG